MSSRLLGYSLLVLVSAFTLPMIAPTQSNNNPAPTPWVKWEYKVVSIDGNACSYDSAVLNPLNSLGQEGWELVSYEHAAPDFPKQADGKLLIAPAATGPNRDVVPQTADSFAGTISMKMSQAAAGGCRMILKRQARPPAPQ